MSYFTSGFLLAAKALGAKDWSHPKCIRLARHMAHDGYSIDEIRVALGWDVTHVTARRRLRKFNIIPRAPVFGSAHRGDEPYLSPTQCRTGVVDQRDFRA